jgi:hypothetical protein
MTAQTALPQIVPTRIPDRHTVDGWRYWRETRRSFNPAPVITSADFDRLSPRAKKIHNLHRAATHANLPLLDTPMSIEVARILQARLQSNSLKHRPVTRPGLMITGGGYQGKTETACEVAAEFEDFWLELHANLNPNASSGTRDLHVPVAYVQTPVTAKPKSTCKAILDFFGADHHNMNLPELTQQVKSSLHDHGVRVLILDDITRLKMHRADDQDTLDLLRAFMSMHVTLVLIGVNIPGSGLLREGRPDPISGQFVFSSTAVEDQSTQTERRFDLLHLDPFRYDSDQNITAWVEHLAGVEQQLRLFKSMPGMLTSGIMPEYIFRRTAGIVGLLERLIEDGCTEAIASGEEVLNESVLDRVTINLGNDHNRDSTAGEIPEVPSEPKPSRPSRPRRGRNTVLDDPGIPAMTLGSTA